MYIVQCTYNIVYIDNSIYYTICIHHKKNTYETHRKIHRYIRSSLSNQQPLCMCMLL